MRPCLDGEEGGEPEDTGGCVNFPNGMVAEKENKNIRDMTKSV